MEWLRVFASWEKSLLLHPDVAVAGPDVAPVRIAAETHASCAVHLQRRLALEFTGRLADGLSFVEDKTSMAHSLEVRMPFLDRGVVDAALRCPSEMKVRRGRQKYVLSQLVRRLPAAIANRGKFGVMAPMESLVKPPLASFTREVLLDNARGHGLFNRAYLETQLDRWTQPEHYHDYARAVVLLFLQIWWTESFTGAQQA